MRRADYASRDGHGVNYATSCSFCLRADGRFAKLCASLGLGCGTQRKGGDDPDA